jgi:hypothetical protein
LDLRPTLGELYKKFHGDLIHRKIQQAESEHLTLESGSSDAFLANFYQLPVTAEANPKETLPAS